MIKKVRCIAVDNGGSEIRVKPVGSEDNTLVAINNNVVFIEEKNFRPKDVADVEALCRITEAPNEEFCGIYASGLTGKAYENTMISINSQNKKTDSIDFYKQMVYGIARDALRAQQLDLYKEFNVSPLRNTRSGRAVEISYSKNVMYDYGVVVCIPVREYNGSKDCAEILKDKIEGNYTVEFPLVESKPVVHFSIMKRNIGVVPEGGVAITALKNKITEDSVTLIVDMGHVTTDIALFQGTMLLGRVISSPYAGSTLIGNLRAVLNDEGYFLSDEQVAKVIAEEHVMRGAERIDVKDIVDTQKSLFVKNYLQKEVIQILNMNSINAKQVQFFVPIGAPMNNNDHSTSIEYNIVRSCGLEYAEVAYLADNLRYVNVRQAARFAERILKNMRGTYANIAVV